MRPSLASDSSKTVGSRQTWHGNCLRQENASRVSYVDLDLQGHTDFNHENKCSETVQAIDIKFAVKIVRLKLFNLFSVG